MFLLQVVPDHWLKKFLDTCKTKDQNKLQEFLKEMMYEAFAASQVNIFIILLSDFFIKCNYISGFGTIK